MDAALGVRIDPSGAIAGSNLVVGSLDRIKVAAYDVTGTMSNRFASLRSTLFSVQSIIAGLGVGLISKAFIDAAATTENYQVRLQRLLGSVSEGNRLFDDMSKYASTVAFSYQEIMGAATTLSGVVKGGVDEINNLMPLIADLAAVSGLTIQETTDQIVRMFSAGAASADLFRERGITAMLGFQAGVSYSAEETRKAVIAAWEDPVSKFRGAAADLADTWDGLLSMYGDQWFQFRNTVMDNAPFDFMKASLAELLNIVNESRGDIDEFGKSIGEGLVLAIQKFTLGVASIWDSVRPVFSFLKEQLQDVMDGYNSLPDFMQTWGMVGALLLGKKGIAGLTAISWGIGNIIDMLEGLTTMSSETEKAIADAFINSGQSWDEFKESYDPEALPKVELFGKLADPENMGAAELATAEFFDKVRARMQTYQKEIDTILTQTNGKGAAAAVVGMGKETVVKEALVDLTAYKQALSEAQQIYRSVRTPAEEYAETLERIADLEANQFLDADIAGRARTKAYEEMTAALQNHDDELVKGTNLVRDFGYTFESAMEKAIFSGNSFGDVVKGLIKDLATLAIRQSVIQPLVSGMMGMFAGAFQDGGEFIVPGVGGPDSQLVSMRITPGEKVTVSTPQEQMSSGKNVSVNNYNTINVTDNSDIESKIKYAMQQAESSAYQRVIKDLQINGPVRRLI